MSINFTTKSIFVILILAGFILTSCYEEPIIEPVIRPYSSVRVGNFSYNQDSLSTNLDNFDVYIDGVLKGTVNINTFTAYFDLESGVRSFVLRNGADVIYDKNITITSYEEISVVFDGVYAPAVDTLMSFAPYSISDGAVYLFEAPDPGRVHILVSNTAPNTSTENQMVYSLSFVSSTIDTTIRNLYEYNTTVGLDAPAGDYKISIMEDLTEAGVILPVYDTLSTFTGTFVSGMRENLFLIGDPRTPTVVKDQQIPLPVRPK